jgi:hypothetical protein
VGIASQQRPRDEVVEAKEMTIAATTATDDDAGAVLDGDETSATSAATHPPPDGKLAPAEEDNGEEISFIGDLHYESFPLLLPSTEGGEEEYLSPVVVDESTEESYDPHHGKRARRTSRGDGSSPVGALDDGRKKRTGRGTNSNDTTSYSSSRGMELWIDGEWVDDTVGENEIDDDDNDRERAKISWTAKLARKIAARVRCSKRLP